MSIDLRKYAGSQFIRYEDVYESPIEATIIEVALGKYGKLDLTFDSGERFSLNATNTKILMKAYGHADGDLLGQRIRLVAGKTKYEGNWKDSVLVEPVSPGRSEAERSTPPPPANDMNDEIPF
jgi:hypothetical protein